MYMYMYIHIYIYIYIYIKVFLEKQLRTSHPLLLVLRTMNSEVSIATADEASRR